MSGIKNLLSFVSDSVLNILFPALCVSCEEAMEGKEIICRRCMGNIHLNGSLFCGECRARFPESSKICHKDFPYILGIAAQYKNPAINGLVRELKFGFRKDAAKPLGELLVSYAENLNLPENDMLVVPVPLGKARMRKRGFNQSFLIAEIFSKKFSLEIESNGFIRSKETKQQSEMKNLKERIENVSGCFAVAAPEKFRGRKIVLIDDVSTSGATFFEAATSLKKAGAKKIVALAVAGS